MLGTVAGHLSWSMRGAGERFWRSSQECRKCYTDFNKIQPRLIHETYIHNSALHYSAVTLGPCRSACGRGVGLPAIFVHVRFSVCPRDWPGTHRVFHRLCQWHGDTCLLPNLKEKGWGIASGRGIHSVFSTGVQSSTTMAPGSQSTGDCSGFSLTDFLSHYKNEEFLFTSLFLPAFLSCLPLFLFLTSLFILTIWIWFSSRWRYFGVAPLTV